MFWTKTSVLKLRGMLLLNTVTVQQLHNIWYVWVNSVYVSQLKKQPLLIEGRAAKDKDQTIPRQKRGAKTLLPKKLDNKLIRVVKNLRLTNSAVINYNIVSIWIFVEMVGIGIQKDEICKQEINHCKSNDCPGLNKETGLTFYNDIRRKLTMSHLP